MPPLTLAELDRLDAAVTAWPQPPPGIMALVGRASAELRHLHALNLDALAAALVALTEQRDEYERRLAAFARHVTVTSKHRSAGCTPATCGKCEAEMILSLPGMRALAYPEGP